MVRGNTTTSGAIEAAMRCAVAAMTDDDRELLTRHGVRETDLPMIGRINGKRSFCTV